MKNRKAVSEGRSWVRRCWERLFGAAPQQPAARQCRPGVEGLEERCLLSTYYSYAVNGSLYNYHIGGMPDLDQRRAMSGAVWGLPNNGAMYCAPTAGLNA